MGFRSQTKFELAQESLSPLTRTRIVVVSSFCEILREENHARILPEVGNHGLLKHDNVYEMHHEAIHGQGISLQRVLHEYELKVPGKVALSHAIAQAFCEFYDIRMMLAKWSSHNIWFMSNIHSLTAELPCRAYIYYPFDLAEFELEEYSTSSLIHKCPRIFALAILLLEISFGRPMHTSQVTSQEWGFVYLMNKDYSTASTMFHELKEQSWEYYKGKHMLDLAIGECLNSRNLSSSS
ncbi:hypothetical protein QQS21_004850 [Conoideocrella luteorostrata]|uniref:DUF7580 domain-containing protein n=1 Tax=Conoideocrella luteorostrata TaxID=1105319 RepID=A0AAJ0CQK8_9HYPO|nr:hypothetical protein QQS21_004850 [Conoideocrella luteorostrata]